MEQRNLEGFLLIAVVTFMVLNVDASGFCDTNSNCTVANTECLSGICNCKQGFTTRNGECSQVLGRVCLDNLDCDDERTFCSDSAKCVCKTSEWKAENGKCVSYYGGSCNMWSDCGNSDRYICENNICKCSAGYQYTNNSCEKVLGSSCLLYSNQTECSLEHTSCKQWGWWFDGIRGQCLCDAGYTEKDGICIQVLGSSCDDVTCGNTMHYTYEFLTGKSTFWSINYWPYYSSYHLHLRCDTDNVCSCDHGFIRSNNSCIPVVGRNCTTQNDCGQRPGYACNKQTNMCDCAQNFTSRVQQWYYADNIDQYNNYWYSWYYYGYSQYVTRCFPVIGQSCDYVNCSLEYSVCNSNNTCVCRDGYTATSKGTCEQVLGMSCVRDTFCLIVKGGTCGSGSVCVCSDGYTRDGHQCLQVLGSNCSTAGDCKLTNSACVAGKCQCASGFTEIGTKCLRQGCAADVPFLPDMHRRYIYRKSVRDEPVIDDALLKEGWYSIGQRSLHVSLTVPDAGYCSTYYPIYLKNQLSATQIATMEASDVTLYATVGRLDFYGQSENITIKMRKCGTDTHIYILPPKTHFSGICLSHDKVLSTTKYGGLHALLIPTLLFGTKNDTNRTKYVPYLVFSCLPSEVKGNVYTAYPYVYTAYYPYTSYPSDEDVYFYYVDWYVDDINFRSIGPVKRINLVYETSLFEEDLLKAGLALGFQIRCSLEISESPNGQRTSLVISEPFKTGFVEPFVSVDENAGEYFLQLTSDTPFGCETFEGDNYNNCEMKWPVLNTLNNNSCGNISNGQINTQTCFFSMRGDNYNSYYMYGNSWSSNSWYRTYNYSHTYNGTHEYNSYDTFGFLVDISGNMADLDTFKIKFSTSNQSSGHRLWDGYKMPDIAGRVVKSSVVPGICMVTQFDFPVIYSDNNSLISDKVVMETGGEFIFYRSRTSPVEIQVKTEECTSSSRKLCICGITFRDGESIHTVNYCNGVARVGQLYGRSNTRDLKKVRFTNGMLLSISIKDSRNSSFVLMLSNFMTGDGEGLCTFSPGSFKLRNGVESSTNTGFLTSWSILTEESLLNPVNHKPYQWVEKYSLCYCPIDAKTRNVTYTYSYNYTSYVYSYEQANVYTSHFRCSSQNQCSTNHSGEEWKDSLLPAFALDGVVAKMEIRYNEELPLLYLICAFDKQDNLRYKITWKLDNVIIFQSKVMTATDAGKFYVTNNNFKTNTFLLEAAFSCGVSVHDTSNKMLIEALYSNEMKAIEFVATEILLPRGGDINVQLKLNIPLACKKKSRCYFDFKLYDPKESYSCSDSTIAFKSKDTCGTRVSVGVSDTENSRDEANVPDVVNKVSFVNITVTTKNNNAYVLRDTFTLKMRLVVTGKTSSFWTNTFSKNLTVFVRDDEAYWQRNYCYANNDPRMRTFDGQYYTNVLVDEFVMMKHKKLPVEVQLETHYGGWYSCGVTVRAGRDVYTINHCHGDHITGYLLADDRILKVKKRNEHRYEIYLPHGTRIDVQINSWRDYIVNVYIYPSPSDMKQVEGLCGNFDGDINGDLVHSDGSVTFASYYYWWWWWISNPDSFIQSWGVNTGIKKFQSLMDIEAIEQSLKSWYADDVLCICTGENGSGEVKCSANERDTCESAKEPPGKDVSVKKRDKRSGQILDSEYKFRTRKMKEKRAANRENPQRFVRRRSIEDEETAVNDSIALCRQMLSSSCNIMSVQNDGLNVTFEELVFNCGQDKAANPEVDWTALTCAAIETCVEHEIQLDVQFQNDNPELVSSITENLCVGNCSGNGNCIQGECVCFAGFTASDCSLDLSATVAIEGITGDGVCDINSYDCTCIRLTTSGSIENTKYNLRHREIQNNGSLKETGTYVGTVVYDNFNEVFVCLEVASRRKRSTGGWTSIGDLFDIALSNDGTTYSNSTKVYVLDSTCLKVNNASDTVILLPGFCIIHGVCYSTNTTSSTDTCYFCNDTANQFDWTRDGKESCLPVDESSGVKAYVIGIAVAVAVLAVVAVVIVAVFVVKKTLATRVAVYDGDLFEMSKNKQTIVTQLRKEETVEEITAAE